MLAIHTGSSGVVTRSARAPTAARSQTQHSRHAPPTARADLLHEISAQPYRRHGLGEREHADGDRGGEGSDRVPGDKGGYKASVVGQGASRCHARDQQRQLDIGGRLQRLGGVQVVQAGRRYAAEPA
jgi:hypothetical protein